MGQNVNNDTWGWVKWDGIWRDFTEYFVYNVSILYNCVFLLGQKKEGRKKRKIVLETFLHSLDLWSWCCALSLAKVRIRAEVLTCKAFSWREVRYFRCSRFYSTTCSSSLLPSLICNGSVLNRIYGTSRHLYIKILEVLFDCSIWPLSLKFIYISLLVKLIKSFFFFLEVKLYFRVYFFKKLLNL